MSKLIEIGEDEIGVIFVFAHFDIVFHLGVIDLFGSCIVL
jgi:hypothetical protein